MMGNTFAAALNRLFSRLSRQATVALLAILLFQFVAMGLLVSAVAPPELLARWFSIIALSMLITLLLGLVFLYLLERTRQRGQRSLGQAVGHELQALRTADSRARSLQAMASTLSATLSFERVVDQSLDVCSLALEEMGVPRSALVGAVFLYEDGVLRPIASRRFPGSDVDRTIEGRRGVVGAALQQAEPVITNNPESDPELSTYQAFRDCLTAVCVPLRAGFQLFGAMVIGTDTALQFEAEHTDLFRAVGDQAVISLQNAQLYQRLEAEKQRLIEADETARRELARDLHDGPTQTIALVAMRLNFARNNLIDQDPERAKAELQAMEELIKRTSMEVRSMLFALRPLVLETQGLGAAVDTALKRFSETDGIEMQLIGGEYGRLLGKQAQGVVFAIIEEALNNARKHAQASLIEVEFRRADDLFVATVHDNGTGFDQYDVNRDYSTRGSLGMVNMRERAERIDGSVRVESSPAGGTTVMLVVPLDRHGLEAGMDETATGHAGLVNVDVN